MEQGKSLIDNLLLTFNFSVSTMYGGFRASKVRNIEQSIALEEVHEGGCNDYVHTLIKPIEAKKQLVFERGYCNEADELAIEKQLGLRQEQPMSICIYDRTGTKILKNYSVEGWMVTKWQVADLDAGSSGGILLETVEVTYERLKAGGGS